MSDDMEESAKEVAKEKSTRCTINKNYKSIYLRFRTRGNCVSYSKKNQLFPEGHAT
jgi:hypothetical protein